MSDDISVNNQKIDFLTLMDNYDIIVPRIQRDYVQGRYTDSAQSTRESFPGKLFGAITGDEKLPLDFIYGTVTDGESAESKKRFYPLDGQQRLTTLFLLAWLCGKIPMETADKTTKENKKWTFKYESRRSAQIFLEELTKHPFQELDEIKEQLSNSIKATTWFFSAWEDDISVAGMLNMLDALYRTYQTLKDKSSFDFKRVFFYVHELKVPTGGKKDISTDYDQIFLKMNARGKPLSDWDNLKARLDALLDYGKKKWNDFDSRFVKYLPTSMTSGSKKIKDYWAENVNLTWPEELWKDPNNDVSCKDPNKDVSYVDQAMSYCVALAFAATFEEDIYLHDVVWEYDDASKVKWKFAIDKTQIRQNRMEDYFTSQWEPELPPEKLPPPEELEQKQKELEQKQKETLVNFFDAIFTFFSILTEHKSPCLKDFMSPWGAPLFPNLMSFQKGKEDSSNQNQSRRSLLAYYAYRNCRAATDQKRHDWMRVIWNLLYSVTIRDISGFRKTFLSVRELCKYSDDILRFLSQFSKSKPDGVNEYQLLYNGFNKDQLDEECEKAKQIMGWRGNHGMKDETWYWRIKEAEKYAFFHGFIRFLFRNANNEVDWNNFDVKFKNAQQFFDDNGVKAPYAQDGMLMRALLSRIKMRDGFMGWALTPVNCVTTWKEIILRSAWEKLSEAVHSLLTVSPPDAFNTFSAWIANTKDNQTVHQKEGNCSPVSIEIVNDLVKTNLLASVNIDDIKIEERNGGYCLRKKGKWEYSDIYIGLKRNRVLSSSMECYPKLIRCSKKLGKTPFFYGINILFDYEYNNKTYYFQWWDFPQKTAEKNETDVYIYDPSVQDCQKRDPFAPSVIDDIQNYYCAEIPADASPEKFIEILNNLIKDYESTCHKHAGSQEATQTS